MRLVETLTDPVSLDDLGPSVVGETLLIGLSGHTYWESPELSEAAELVTRALAAFRTAGVATVVDITTIDLGRDVALMHRAAVYGGVNLIGSTGLAGRGGVIPAAIGTLTVEELASIYVRELTEAVPGTDVRAGTIVLGPEEGSDELAAHLALASSLAHAETSAPIVVLGGPLATIQARRVLARGADPEHVLVCGVDTGQLSFDELDELAGMGVRIGFTQIGKEFALADEARASLIAYSLRRYGTDRVCFGTGSWARWLGPGEPEGAHRPGGTILMEFIDRLATYGVGADTVNEVLTSGVRSLFTSQAAV